MPASPVLPIGCPDRSGGPLCPYHSKSSPPNQCESAECRIIRAGMTKKGITFSQLVGMLESAGVSEEEHNLRNKVSRGKFTASFMLQCLTALGVSKVEFGP